MLLNESARRNLGEHAARIEARTGTQVVAAVIARCDAYPESPWLAFALFASLAALAASFWPAHAVPPGLTFLGAGAVAALGALLLPPFARLFVSAARREAQTRRYADTFFLAHRLSQTTRRNAILLLVGAFERSVVILPDTGIGLKQDALQHVIARMKPRLRDGQTAAALHDGLDALEALLVAQGFTSGDGADEIAQEVFEEKGA